MNVEQYFKSLGSEFTAIKNRVRDFIDDRHWLTDGEWKESVLRSFLRNICPESFIIARGFVITENKPTSQLDVIIYNNKSPVLFKDNDLVFLPSRDISVILEVKTKLTRNNIDDAINHLKNTFDIIKPHRAPQMLYGLFSYEIDENLTTVILDKLNQAHAKMNESFIQLLCLGNNHLVKYWGLMELLGCYFDRISSIILLFLHSFKPE